MPIETDEVAYFRLRVTLLVRDLTERFDELEANDFPNTAPSELIDLVKSILGVLREKIDKADEKELPLHFSLVRHYQTFLSYIDNAHTEQAPVGLVSILKHLLNGVNPGTRFFVAPHSESYNYSIQDLTPRLLRPVQNLFTETELSSLKGSPTTPLRLIRFPRVERDNVLAHAVFGHEVGHILSDEYLIAEQGTPAYGEAVKKAIEALEVANGSAFSIKERAEFTSALCKTRRRAMEEILSDYANALIFGPSSLFAIHYIFAFSQYDSLPTSPDLYPPERMRIRVSFRTAEEEGFLDAIASLDDKSATPNYFHDVSSLINRLRDVVDSKEDEKALSSNPFTKIVYAWVQDTLQVAKDDIKASLPANLMYSSETFQNEVPGLLERLSLRILPNELGVYPDIQIPEWQSALCAAWVFRISGKPFVGSNTAGPPGPEDLQDINRYCLNAIERISLSRDYSSHMSS